MKKRIFFSFFVLIYVQFIFSQNNEMLGKLNDIKYKSGVAGGSDSPVSITVNEIENTIEIPSKNEKCNKTYNIDEQLKFVSNNSSFTTWYTYNTRIKSFLFQVTDNCFEIYDNKKLVFENFLTHTNQSGISFILKKGNGYIVYYVNEAGLPGAVDTEGKVYSNKEAIEYLKQYDPEKYEQSLLRAEELGLKKKFEEAEVLVWGETYYSALRKLGSFYEEFPFNNLEFIQYDQNGYGYQMIFDYEETKLCIINPDGKNLTRTQYEGYKKFLVSNNFGVSYSWYVGFGGNIYYYIAGEEYTEVFRIRRTWGAPDFYAMAINGYTDDEYGKYVDEVLPKLSKEELRLLRNTIFALYGVHFKSEDLSKYFDKQVWYTDEGKASGEIELPEHRQKLVEMIQKLEK